MNKPRSSPVTDAMVERAWAAIVGADVAGICFQASIIRADLRTGLEAMLDSAQDVPSDPLAGLAERLDRLLLTSRDNERFVLSTESAKNIVGIVRVWLRAHYPVPSTDSRPLTPEEDRLMMKALFDSAESIETLVPSNDQSDK